MGADGMSTDVSFWGSLRVGRAKRERLLAEIAMTAERVAKRRAAANPLAQPAPGGGWWVHAEHFLQLARDKAAHREPDAAWKHLHEARRQEVFGYAASELAATVTALRYEASEKLSGWRRDAIIKTLDQLNAPPPADDDGRRCLLAFAMHLRDERNDDGYFKLSLIKGQILLLVWVLAALLLAFVALAFATPLFPDRLAGIRLGNIASWSLAAGMILGAAGACFSGLISLTGVSAAVSVPERIASTSVTMARPLIGAASALAAVLLLSAGLLAALSEQALYAAAFAAGFSERLAIGALDKLSK